jgi:hypothetical protein
MQKQDHSAPMIIKTVTDQIKRSATTPATASARLTLAPTVQKATLVKEDKTCIKV